MSMDQESRDLLIRIDTKLTVVCGEDGNGGILAKHGERIDNLEADRDRRKGAKWAFGIAWSAIIGLIEWWHTHKH